jgi:hypothetical protein
MALVFPSNRLLMAAILMVLMTFSNCEDELPLIDMLFKAISR